jgi:hypothetical protein
MVLKKTGAIFRTWPVDSGVKVQSWEGRASFRVPPGGPWNPRDQVIHKKKTKKPRLKALEKPKLRVK